MKNALSLFLVLALLVPTTTAVAQNGGYVNQPVNADCSGYGSFHLHVEINIPNGSYTASMFDGNSITTIFGNSLLDTIISAKPGMISTDFVFMDSTGMTLITIENANVLIEPDCDISASCVENQTVVTASNGEVAWHINNLPADTSETYVLNETSYVVAYGSLSGEPLDSLAVLDTCGTTAVHESVRPTLPSVYPNPASGSVTVSHRGMTSYTIYNKMGQVVRSAQANESVLVDLSDIPSGIYFATTSTNSEPVKFMVE